MAKVVVYLPDLEMNALHLLAEKEYGPVKTQATLIIRNELKRLGMVAERPIRNDLGLQKSPHGESGSVA